MKISGNIVDIFNKQTFKGEIEVENSRIKSIIPKSDVEDHYILPGFVDAHVHIESSMVIPSEFARMAVLHGTVATVSDSHEIGNVLGLEGVEFMIANGQAVPFKFYFGAPSCVPATTFETAGATISVNDIETLFKRNDIKYLAEMMNWPGVLHNDAEVFEKLAIAKKYNKQIDGHAPGLRGEQARKYASAGITTDHECFTAGEALDKLKLGMKILIREGSAAKNFEALIDLVHEHYSNMMFCSDDKHPDALEEGHINQLVLRALGKGIDLYKVLQVACVNPVEHYKLDVGLLRVGDPADFIVVKDLKNFVVKQTFINGNLVADNHRTLIKPIKVQPINKFNIGPLKPTDFELESDSTSVRVIEALDGELITNPLVHDLPIMSGKLVGDIESDVLKIVVVNRYIKSKVAVSFVKNFGLKQGALASSVAHDSHNIIAVGISDEMICRAVNTVIDHKGGVVAVDDADAEVVALPLAGLMSAEDGFSVAEAYKRVDRKAKAMGSQLRSPFMTLSFMALLVIPSLKLSDRGLFDGDQFRFVDTVIK